MPIEPTSIDPAILWLTASLFIAYPIYKFIIKKFKFPTNDEMEKDYFNKIPFYIRFLKGIFFWGLWIIISSFYFFLKKIL